MEIGDDCAQPIGVLRVFWEMGFGLGYRLVNCFVRRLASGNP